MNTKSLKLSDTHRLCDTQWATLFIELSVSVLNLDNRNPVILFYNLFYSCVWMKIISSCLQPIFVSLHNCLQLCISVLPTALFTFLSQRNCSWQRSKSIWDSQLWHECTLIVKNWNKQAYAIFKKHLLQK